MEETLPSVPSARNVNRKHQRRPQKTKNKQKPKRAHDDKEDSTCQFCGLDHKGPRSQCPASGKTCGGCSKKGHFARMCKGKKKPRDVQHKQKFSAKCVQQEEQEDTSDSDFVFQLTADKSNTPSHATVQVRINGVKGEMKADSCSTANIMNENKFESLQAALEKKITLKLTDTQLYAFAQNEPVPLIGCFDAEVKGVNTGRKTTAHILVAKGVTKSRPLLSLDTSVERGLLHMTNATQEKAKQPAESHTGASPADPLVAKLMLDRHDVFSGLGKHKYIKAKLIVDGSVQPVSHKQRRIPYNLAQKVAREELRLREQGVIAAVPDNQPISFPESAILLACAKDLELWDNPCQNSCFSRSDWLLCFTGSSLRAVSFETGNENVERLLANVLFTSETENGKEDR